MKVSELIALLQQERMDDEVLLVTQMEWPIISETVGVSTDSTQENAVLIVQGTLIGYGTKQAWRDMKSPVAEQSQLEELPNGELRDHGDEAATKRALQEE